MNTKELSLEDRVRRALASLGDTPEEIAAKLKRRGIRGTDCTDSCPLANFIRKTVPEVITVEVNSVEIAFADQAVIDVAENNNGFDIDRHATKITQNVACRDFVLQFDNGKFPFLEEK